MDSSNYSIQSWKSICRLLAKSTLKKNIPATKMSERKSEQTNWLNVARLPN